MMGFTAAAIADDGPMFRKNVSGTPDLETEFAAIRTLPLYVPPQTSGGVLLPAIEYYNAEGALMETREYARPLIGHYTDGHVDSIDDEAYPAASRVTASATPSPPSASTTERPGNARTSPTPARSPPSRSRTERNGSPTRAMSGALSSPRTATRSWWSG
jgi:hypothetical protein